MPAPGVLYGHPPDRAPRQKFAEHPEGGFERRTYARGWREDVDLGEKRGPRVLVIGDSHVEGVVRNGVYRFATGAEPDAMVDALDAFLANEAP